MKSYEKANQVMVDLFQKDYQFALATVKDNVPSVRYIDTYYDNEAFYVVTYLKSQKAQEILRNQHVALCHNLYRFNGKAYYIGHPKKDENQEIRAKLIKAFEPWYFAHNNEEDENMAYIKIELEDGFVYNNGIGYKVDFKNREAEEFPFDFNVVTVS